MNTVSTYGCHPSNQAEANRCLATGSTAFDSRAYGEWIAAQRDAEMAQVSAMYERWGAQYDKFEAMGWHPQISDGRCHDGLVGCFVEGGVNLLTSPVQCALDGDCRAIQWDRFSRFGPGGVIFVNTVESGSAWASRTADDIQTGQWDDLAFQMGELFTFAVTLKGAAKGGKGGDVPAYEGASGAEPVTIQSILKPGGNAIGRAGSRPSIRELPGGQQGAQSWFDMLSSGGRDVTPPGYKGRMVELPDGTRVGIRSGSDGVPTIDVKVPGDPLGLPRFAGQIR